MAGRVADVHAHYVPPSLVEAFKRRTEPPRIFESDGNLMLQYGQRMARKVTPTMVDLDAKLEHMAETGIDATVVTVNIPGVDWFPKAEAIAVARATNDEMIDAARAHPGKIVGLATIPLQAPEEAAAELERAVAAGMPGAHLYSNVAGRPLDEPEFRVVFDTAAALDVPISLHPTYPLAIEAYDVHALVPVLGYLADSTGGALRLVFDGLYERHPDFKLVLAHVGSLIPYLVGRIDYESTRMGELGALTVPPREHLRRIYTDTICGWSPALKLAVDFFGGDRVMFGTDQPFWEPAVTFEALEGAGLDAATDEAVRWGNAARLYGLPA